MNSSSYIACAAIWIKFNKIKNFCQLFCFGSFSTFGGLFNIRVCVWVWTKCTDGLSFRKLD